MKNNQQFAICGNSGHTSVIFRNITFTRTPLLKNKEEKEKIAWEERNHDIVKRENTEKKRT